MQKVIISILHYKSNKDTLACLNSLLTSNLKGIEITTIVLDNASPERLEVDESMYKKINLIVMRNSENAGFTGGHNLVYESSMEKDFDYFLLLNNDSLVETNTIQELIKIAQDNRVGAVVPKIYFTKGMEFHKTKYSEKEKGKVFWYAGGRIDWDNVMSIHRGVDEVDNGQYDREEKIDFATGACLLLKKSVLKVVGLFDDKYFLYYEDADLNVKIDKAGFDIVYAPRSVVWHNNAGSSGSGSELHDYYLTRNRLLFGMRYAPLRTKVALTRESLRLIVSGRKWQKIGIKDYYLGKFGKGSFQPQG